MFPRGNSHLHNPSNHQLQNTALPGSAPLQVIGIPSNLCPNPMQIHPQFPMGVFNNQQLALPPLTNPTAYFPSSQLFPFAQGSLPNLTSNNYSQLFGNVLNQPQFFPNGQFNVPNLVQNVNQLLPMQLVNCGPESSGLLANARMGFVNDSNRVLQASVNGSAGSNAGFGTDFGSFQGQPNQNVFSHGVSKPQSNAGAVNPKSWRKSHNKSFSGSFEPDASGGRFRSRQVDYGQNTRGNFNHNNDIQERGQQIAGAKNLSVSHTGKPNQVEKRRSLVLNYTMQEILQWREERRKNFPTKNNMEKKLKENPTQPKVTDAVAKSRRQDCDDIFQSPPAFADCSPLSSTDMRGLSQGAKQLKEILAKQAELGCEVAEIPSCYLSDSEEQVDCRAVNKTLSGKREKFQHRFNKQGQFRQNDRFPKRQRARHRGSVNSQDQSGHFTKNQRLASCGNPCMDNKNEPSLLKKLLKSDLKRDNKRLQQVFRFIVMNSFFKNLPENPLKYPEVIVRDSGDVNEMAKESAQILEGGAFDATAETPKENFTDGSDDSDGSSDVDEPDAASCGGDDVNNCNGEKA